MSEFLAAQLGKKRPEIAMPPIVDEPQKEAPNLIEASSESQPDLRSAQRVVGTEVVQEATTQESHQEPVRNEPVQQETAQAKNFRELREKAERAAREAQQAQQERDALAQRIKELESSYAKVAAEKQ